MKKLIVGLGNPGRDYEATRHNAGFLAVDALVRTLDPVSFSLKKDLFSEVATLHTDGMTLILAKPQTFMNMSGKAVMALKKFYDLEDKDIWVLHDDLDLPLGKAQIRFGGGTAGQHGIESIVDTLKTADFGRARIGIRGHELRAYHEEKGIDTNGFVMGRLTDHEQKILATVFTELNARLMPTIKEHKTATQPITVPGYEKFDNTKA
jgi:PTH1 family peptidyl-tRNA hydrolase